jgi:hypothetical protein
VTICLPDVAAHYLTLLLLAVRFQASKLIAVVVNQVICLLRLLVTRKTGMISSPRPLMLARRLVLLAGQTLTLQLRRSLSMIRLTR